MSEWIDIKDNEDVELSNDGKEIEVLFETNQFGNRYINIPAEFIRKVLPSQTQAGSSKYVAQVGELILQDGDDMCVIASDIRCTEKPNGMSFMIHNERTGTKYRVDISIEEI